MSRSKCSNCQCADCIDPNCRVSELQCNHACGMPTTRCPDYLMPYSATNDITRHLTQLRPNQRAAIKQALESECDFMIGWGTTAIHAATAQVFRTGHDYKMRVTLSIEDPLDNPRCYRAERTDVAPEGAYIDIEWLLSIIGTLYHDTLNQIRKGSLNDENNDRRNKR